jgi:3',5'-cyclic AMP phosphodiesterase CpdA
LVQRIDLPAATHVVVSGDLTVDGADNQDDLAWAASELTRLGARSVLSLPGNHDVGEECETTHAQVIDDVRRQRWLEHFGADWWTCEAANWRLLGINSQLLGSGLAAEVAQWSWLEETLAVESLQPTGVFLHKPLFLEREDEPDHPGHATLGVPRRRLLALLARGSVRFIACGHLHQYRAFRCDEFDYIWAPSSAFLINERLPGGVSELGYVVYTLHENGQYVHEFVAARELKTIDLEVLKGGGYRYLRDIAPGAVAGIMAQHGIAAVS